MSTESTLHMNKHTSCHSQSDTESGFSFAFAIVDRPVRSRQRASTTSPFFSFTTYTSISERWLEENQSARTSGLMHKFFLLVKPRPVYASSFFFCSSVSAFAARYAISRFNSARAFSISGTVREQYMSFRRVG